MFTYGPSYWLTAPFTAEFRPVYNIETYVVTVLYAGDRLRIPTVIREWRQNGTEVYLIPWEGSGVYDVTVRVKNRCDQIGRHSAVLRVEMGPADTTPAAPPPAVWCDYCHGAR